MHASLDNIIIKKAEPVILPQIKRFYRDHGFRAQAPKSDDIYIALLDNKLIGALRLIPVDNHWLLRSMCVHEEYRGKGVGSYMLGILKDVLREKQCYCFPYTHLKEFYSQIGFKRIETNEAPFTICEKYRMYLNKKKNILLMQLN